MKRLLRLETVAFLAVVLGLVALWINQSQSSLELNAATASPREASPSQVPTTPTVDLRPEFKRLGLQPRRQGRRGTCSVFTTAAAMEFALSKQSNKQTLLSVEYLNWACNQVIHNKADRGQFFHDLLAGYEHHGICLEEEMPYARRYDPELVPNAEAVESAARIRAYGLRFHWIKRLDHSPGLSPEQFEKVIAVLDHGYAVAAGASHSRLFVGYVDDETQFGGGVFLTKDSGKGAFSKVSYEFAKTQVNDAFWVDLAEANEQ